MPPSLCLGLLSFHHANFQHTMVFLLFSSLLFPLYSYPHVCVRRRLFLFLATFMRRRRQDRLTAFLAVAWAGWRGRHGLSSLPPPPPSPLISNMGGRRRRRGSMSDLQLTKHTTNMPCLPAHMRTHICLYLLPLHTHFKNFHSILISPWPFLPSPLDPAFLWTWTWDRIKDRDRILVSHMHGHCF